MGKTTHGQCKKNTERSPEYKAWVAMKARCYVEANPSHKRYSERGIVVCDEWRDSFDVFLESVGKRPSPDCSLERINNDKNYEPGNVRWATASEQQNNKENTIWISFMGMDRPITEWAKIVGVSPNTLRSRYRRGWSHEEIICGKH